MHHEVGVGQTFVDFLDALDRKNFTGGLARELVSAVARADGDGQSVELGFTHEVGGLIGIGEKLFTGHGRIRAVTVFLVALHGFQRTQAAEFAFDGHADAVGVFNHAAGDVDVVFVGGNGLAVAHKRTVHHHRRKAHAHGDLADGRALAVVLMHANRNVRPAFHGGFDDVAQERFAGILAGAGARLHDDRSADFGGSRHDGLHLFDVVDVEGGNAVTVFRCMIKQLAHAH